MDQAPDRQHQRTRKGSIDLDPTMDYTDLVPGLISDYNAKPASGRKRGQPAGMDED
ncbi:hypothetical protein SLEP1_g43174 [Rubroshorea leprosula]|uniref:Uncharacterized protein n=1 Tax=Rubroshorea leprosula TaxID=152421 RepID=A0AAV5LC56_9ROSI|nr:hypothetical protein SLEP1_g43174 [Rubroshorea leprosula]